MRGAATTGRAQRGEIMKHLIYWFSGTGNTLAVAKELAAKLGDAELREIRPGATTHADGDADTVGILYPVYCWGPPNAVSGFARGLAVSEGAHVYSVAVYGGMLAGANAVLKKMLGENDIDLAATFAVHLPGNFVGMYEIAPEEKRAAMYAKASAAVARIAASVKTGKRTGIARNLGLFGRYLSAKQYGPMMAQIHLAGKGFTVDDACTGCGVCARVCPANNVRLDSGKPHWDDRCESCLACLHWCPVAAIQSGEKTRVHGRYHHPGVAVSEFYRQ